VLATVVLALVVAVFILSPLRGSNGSDRQPDQRRAALEVAKAAKYREIRDAELDLAMGKLSRADHRELDRQLRAEAIEILRELDRD